jgi:hypothetical protein
MTLKHWAAALALFVSFNLQAQTSNSATAAAEEYQAKTASINERNAKVGQINSLIKQARASAAKNDFDTSSSLMQQAVSILPDEPLLWVELADAQVGQRQFHEAVESYQKAIALNDTSRKLDPTVSAKIHIKLAQASDLERASVEGGHVTTPTRTDTDPSRNSTASGPTLAETIGFINKIYQEQGAFPVTLMVTSRPGDSNPVTVVVPHVFDVQYIILESGCEATIRSDDTPNGLHLIRSTVSLGDVDPLSISVVSYNSGQELSDSEYYAFRADPDLFMVIFGTLRKNSPVLGVFAQKSIAERVAKAYIHATVLCGAKGDPF